MQLKHLKFLLIGALVEGLLVLVLFMLQPSEQENAHLFGFSYLRLGLALSFLLFLSALFIFTLKIFQGGEFAAKIRTKMAIPLEKDELSGKRLFKVQGGLVILLVAVVEAYLLTYFSIPPRLQPFLLWAALVLFQTWLTLRIVYRPVYRLRSTWRQKFCTAWAGWSPIQKRVFFWLLGIGLVYFIAFIPANTYGWHSDEWTIYPDAVRILQPGSTFKETLQHLIVNENWWYGYPFFVVSAIPLIVPRLIYGPTFGDHMALNLLLLRQFISILPMILSIGLLVYMVTGFKSRLKAIGLYVFLLLVPGVFMNNYHFWHPDSLVLLLVVLTIFFLRRDAQRFGKDFYLAAVFCGLAVAIKFWGLFFFLTIAVYLLTGLATRRITWKKMLLLGVLFILVMGLTVILSSPTVLIPWSYDMLVHGLNVMSTNIAQGFDEPDPLGAYRTGLGPWLTYFDIYFMKPYFFFFAFASLALGCFLGPAKDLNRLFLTWCLVLGVYFIGFVVVKRFQYMIQLAMPLYAAAFLFPTLAEAGVPPSVLSFLGKPLTRKVLWALTIAVYGSQFIFNILSILTSPWIGVFVTP